MKPYITLQDLDQGCEGRWEVARHVDKYVYFVPLGDIMSSLRAYLCPNLAYTRRMPSAMSDRRTLNIKGCKTISTG